MKEGNTFINALIGAIVTAVVGGFIPFGPAAGGAVAGYLQGGTRSDGLKVGVLSGIIGLIPLTAVLFLALSFFGVIAVGSGEAAGLAIGGVIAVGIFALVAIYTVGLSALGGWIGNYVKQDTDIDI
ncbi:hypothetical protein C475_10308 [Halosimplex carlsbadense 2-9-1]|uniref:DUF5518 domain-containing protein n=1 Tax=Halosimplex carlsbadense 2-9-1 TaxID=797114 RepID=M0CSH7_9EURY|nr:DUF5518 domain-containing protein [Halosimplex carlsbadense]ELZ25588.1 hypothetical protein C475_10308 [Halosimplex carlsbadense 2-9-1]